MPRLSFLQFIQEKYFDILHGSSIFKNPSESDVIEITKTSPSKMIRFLSIASLKTVFVWDADSFIHINFFNLLKRKHVIANDANFYNYLEFFAGVAKIEAGQLVYDSSDELNFYIRNFSKGMDMIILNELETEFNMFSQSAISMQKAHAFAQRYIKGLDGPDNPFFRIHQIVQKVKP